MSEDSRGKLGPDHFSYYASEVERLLQEEDSCFLTSQTAEILGNKHEHAKWEDRLQPSCALGSSFSNSVGPGLTDFQREMLKLRLQQSVVVLTSEAHEDLFFVLNEAGVPRYDHYLCLRYKTRNVREDSGKKTECLMLDPVISMCRLQSQLTARPALSKADAKQGPSQNVMVSSYSSSTNTPLVASPSNSSTEADDLKFLLENNSSHVEKTVKKYSDELLSTLEHMERKLEELLDAVASKCRPMTHTEKQQLQKLIKKLPPKKLDRVVEIVQRSKPIESQDHDEIFVNLEEKDNATVWRLYYYAEAAEKARLL
ncbi:hypothetical protein DKX38_004347 [Salix brachista]|uniref:NET domain-containing protein n=1 Tax=Salix brachista TaxID=2182728 RepID=A0A5N5NCE2_9ROSI|nr:hypothetical protein DKX38_004347 [Salix brachista]